MSSRAYRPYILFEATISIVGAQKLGIYFPKEVEKELAKYKGKKVLVQIYVPSE